MASIRDQLLEMVPEFLANNKELAQNINKLCNNLKLKHIQFDLNITLIGGLQSPTLFVEIIADISAKKAQQLSKQLNDWWIEETKDKPIDFIIKSDCRTLEEKFEGYNLLRAQWYLVDGIPKEIRDKLIKLTESLGCIHRIFFTEELLMKATGSRVMFTLVPKARRIGPSDWLIQDPIAFTIKSPRKSGQTLDDIDDEFEDAICGSLTCIELSSFKNNVINGYATPSSREYYKFLETR